MNKLVEKKYLITFILITSLFALWGFANDITNPMVAAFKTVMDLSTFEASLVQLAFYGGYATTVVDESKPVDKMSKPELKELVRALLERHPQSVVYEDKPLRSSLHPTMKPVKLVARFMVNSSQRGDVVADIFGGSGTTLIAAEQLGRRCRMMELDPHYVDVIIARWEEFTGQKAELLNGL